MSVNNGDSARANREAKKHRLHRQRNQELRKTLAIQTPEQVIPNPTKDENQVTSTPLPLFAKDSKANAGEGESAPEIALNHPPHGGYND